MWLSFLIRKTKEVVKISQQFTYYHLYFFGFIFQKLENLFYGFQVQVIIYGTSVIYLTYFKCIISITNKEISNLKGFEIVFGFLAGACNENSSPATLLMAFIYLDYSLPL